LSSLQVTLATALVSLSGQEIALIKAQDELAAYIATAGLEQAAKYLSDWNTVMFGGTLSADGVIDAGGLNQVRINIANKTNALATATLFVGGTPLTGLRAAIVKADKEAAVATKKTELATAVTKQATADALVTNFTTPVDVTVAVKTSLLANRVARLGLDAQKDSLTAVITTTEAGVTNATTFRNQIWNGNLDPRTKTWYDAAVLVAAEQVTKTNNGKVKTAWEAYGTALKAQYDIYFPLISAAKTALDAANAAVGTTTTGVNLALATLYFNNEIAFGNAVLAEVTLRAKGSAVSTRADTTAYINARLAWDGMRETDLFKTAAVKTATGINIDETLTVTVTALTANTYPVKGGVTSITVLTGGGSAGTLKALNDAVAGPTVDAVAIARQAILSAQYKTVVDEFAALNTYITNISGGKATVTAQFPRTIGTPTPDFGASAGFTAYADAIVKVNADNFGAGKALNGVTLSVKAAIDAMTANDVVIKAQTAIVTANEPFLAPYKTQYDAALATIKGGTFKTDSLNIPVRAAQYANTLALAANATAFTDLGTVLTNLTRGTYMFDATAAGTALAGCGVTVATAASDLNCYAYVAPATPKTLATLRTEAATAKTATKAASDAVEKAETELIAYNSSAVKDADIVAQLTAELAVLNIKATVYEALLAKYQALVLAAIG
jgi:hypothetical protein